MPIRFLLPTLLSLLASHVGLADSDNPSSAGATFNGRATPALTPQANGFCGIWFELGQKTKHGDKYSGGLGTYTANHVPLAHYVKKANRTYFTWGGTPVGNLRRLQVHISYFDHQSGMVARPIVVMDKSPVNDPHDNGSLSIDGHGHLWVFVSGRGRSRPGRIYHSTVPYEIKDWFNLGDSEFTYPQPWWFEGKGFLHTNTRYTAGRELYFNTSRDGRQWNIEKKLSGIGGHCQTSEQVGARLITAFNRHLGGLPDRRTDLFYFTNRAGDKVWQLPYNMSEDFATPVLVKP